MSSINAKKILFLFVMIFMRMKDKDHSERISENARKNSISMSMKREKLFFFCIKILFPFVIH